MLDVVLDVRWMYVGCTLDDVGCELQIMLDVVLQRPGFKPRRRLDSELSGSQQVEKHVTAAMYVWPSIEGPPSWAQQVTRYILYLNS
jgi:hypothetical protein